MDLDGLLLEAVARQAAREAARERAKARVLRRAAAEEATLAGTLVAVAERRDVVVVRTTAARSHRGAIAAVGRDFAVVAPAGAAPPAVFVALAAVATVRLAGGGGRGLADGGARPGPVDASLVAVLAGLAPERPRVQVAGRTADATTQGELRSVGADVLVVRLGGDGTDVVVPVSSVGDVVVLDVLDVLDG